MLRIATLNLLHSTDALDERVQHLVSELITEDLDFLLLQEVMAAADAGGYDTLAHLAMSLGLPHVVFTKNDNRRSGNAILSKHPLSAIPPHPLYGGVQPALAETRVDGRLVVLMSHHGSWGPHAVATRIAELKLLDDIAKNRFTLGGAHLDAGTRPIVVLAGDFNSTPDSAPIRYLTGLDHQLGHSTLWVDAAEVAGDPGHTSGDPTVLSIATAKTIPGAPLRPERTPRRRIDYLFVYEWAYGQAGEPVEGRRIAMTPFTARDGRELTVSDHYGVMAHLWIPERA